MFIIPKPYPEPTFYNSANKTAVVTLAVGKLGEKLLALSGASIGAYAVRIGADVHVISGKPTHETFPIDDKFRVAQYLGHYERVIYLDADVMVREDAPNLFELVPETHIGIADEALYGWPIKHNFPPIREKQEEYGYRQNPITQYFNTGIMVLSRQHRHIVEAPLKPYKVYHTTEQDLLNARIHHYQPPIHSFGPDLVYQWFVEQKPDERNRPFIHWAGITHETDNPAEFMRPDLMQPDPQPEAKQVPPAYLINLKRRPDRLAAALAECEKAGISPTVIEAFDGHKLPQPKGWKDGAGAWGCNLSHRAVLSKLLQDGVTKALVLEDDCVFVDDFQRKYSEFMSKVPNDWQAIMLGGQHIQPAQETDIPGVVRPVFASRTHGYIVRGDYIRTLLGYWTDEQGHIDHVWRSHMKDTGVRIYAPDPWLIGQGESKSDINLRELGERWWQPKGTPPPRQIVPNRAALGKPKGCTGCGKKK